MLRDLAHKLKHPREPDSALVFPLPLACRLQDHFWGQRCFTRTPETRKSETASGRSAADEPRAPQAMSDFLCLRKPLTRKEALYARISTQYPFLSPGNVRPLALGSRGHKHKTTVRMCLLGGVSGGGFHQGGWCRKLISTACCPLPPAPQTSVGGKKKEHRPRTAKNPSPYTSAGNLWIGCWVFRPHI